MLFITGEDNGYQSHLNWFVSMDCLEGIDQRLYINLKYITTPFHTNILFNYIIHGKEVKIVKPLVIFLKNKITYLILHTCNMQLDNRYLSL